MRHLPEETFCQQEEKKIISECRKNKKNSDKRNRFYDSKMFLIFSTFLCVILAINTLQSHENRRDTRCEDGAGTYWKCKNCGFAKNKCYELRCRNCGKY
jgi:hypothetical protein